MWIRETCETFEYAIRNSDNSSISRDRSRYFNEWKLSLVEIDILGIKSQ